MADLTTPEPGRYTRGERFIKRSLKKGFGEETREWESDEVPACSTLETRSFREQLLREYNRGA